MNECLSSFCKPGQKTFREMVMCSSVQWGLSPQIAPDNTHHVHLWRNLHESLISKTLSAERSGNISSAKHEGHRKSIQTHLALVSQVTKVVCLDTHDQAGLPQGTWAVKTQAPAACFSLCQVAIAGNWQSVQWLDLWGQIQTLSGKNANVYIQTQGTLRLQPMWNVTLH